MSTWAFAAKTSQRIEADPHGDATSKPSGTDKYIGVLGALVPAEVLAAHAVIMQTVTTQVRVGHGAGAHMVTYVPHTGWVRFAFWSLIVIAVLLYLGGRRATDGGFHLLDLPGALIPPAAFLGWSMLENSSALDAVHDFGLQGRHVLGIVLALALPLFAVGVGFRADKLDHGGKHPERPAGTSRWRHAPVLAEAHGTSPN
jgi:hypothetical protein